jgi:hypothetical protein
VAVAVPAANATQFAQPRVLAVSHVPLVAAQGDRISVSAKVRGTGKRALIGLVLGNPAGSAKGGVALGKGVKVSQRGTKRVLVRGLVPKTVPTGQLHMLLVCVNPAAAVRGRSACRKAARIATSGRSTEERIAGAEQAGRLAKSSGLVMTLRTLRPDKRVPRELRGDQEGPSGEQAPIMNAAIAFGGLSGAKQTQVFPFFVPPRGQGSAWSSHRHAAPAALATIDCKGYGKLDGSVNDWRGVPTSDNNAIVWYAYRTNPQWKQIEAEDRAAAYRYARELPKIWKKLSTEFGPPKSDAAEPCFHGPDGRLDVYVDDSVVWSEAGYSSGALAVTVPYPRSGSFCTDRPAWIAMKNDQPNWALAHEFMHAIQFAHRYASCGPAAWWDEGGATWAGDFVYPDDNYEQKHFPDLVTKPLELQLPFTSYWAWPFWMMAERTQGVGVLRKVFANLRSMQAVPAVDAALTGGYAEQIPRFFLHVWNQSPVGDSGFTISKSFKSWDKWNVTPAVPDAVTLDLNAGNERTINLTIQRQGGFPGLSVGAYHWVKIPNPAVKELRFTNDLVGKPGAHVDALLHLADGSWKLADWTSRKTVTLCRDRASENAKELIIVSTNTKPTALGVFTHELRAHPACARPPFFSGTFSGTAKVDYRELGAGNSADEKWTGQVKLIALAPEPTNAFPWYYTLDSGSVNFSVTGHMADCDINGGTTATFAALAMYPNPWLTISAGQPLTYFLPLQMPQGDPWTVTTSNCTDPAHNGKTLNWTTEFGQKYSLYVRSGTPIQEDGSLAGSASGNSSDGQVAQTWQWNLQPGPTP